MASYRLTADARADLREIAWFGLRQFGEKQAERYSQELEQLFHRIAANPFAYQSVDDLRPGYRRAVYQSHAVYYVLDAEAGGVLIVRVLGQQEALAALPPE